MGFIRFFASIWRLVRIARLLVRAQSSNQVPLGLKMVLPMGLLYLLFPLDAIPDFIPILGQMDDLSLMALLSYVVYLLLPKAFLAAQGWTRGRTQKKTVIEGQYRVVDEQPGGQGSRAGR